MRLLLSVLAALLVTGPAWAGDLAVSLKTPSGAPVTDAVIVVETPGGPPPGPIRFPGPYRMAQKDMQFTPFVLLIPVGAEVAFPNLDPILHHVYSFSPAKTFELKLYGRDETRRVRFDKPGIISVGCNIHDDMTAFIRVVDTPYAAKTDALGQAVVTGLPAGPVTVRIWHPYLKAGRNEVVRQATLPATGVVALGLVADLRATPMKHGGY
ncbi:methylamine utilization protein [Phenylobacterium aquaticum]|uniref:methylamine utilization protein n=1 Tax=Phenylobacterium aquaticum TaxID=1763816 RepID=UPI0026F0574B|nr:methylamine utilization protein [Phenylobacterium aquaticum]